MFTSKWGNILSVYRDTQFNFLEIGLYKGQSLPLWQDYFGPDCKIYGIEICMQNFIHNQPNFLTYEMNALDKIKADELFKATSFSVIIDDSDPNKHYDIFKIYSNFLSDNGTYLIETFKSNLRFFRDLSMLKQDYPNFVFDVVYSPTSLEPAIKAVRKLLIDKT